MLGGSAAASGSPASGMDAQHTGIQQQEEADDKLCHWNGEKSQMCCTLLHRCGWQTCGTHQGAWWFGKLLFLPRSQGWGCLHFGNLCFCEAADPPLALAELLGARKTSCKRYRQGLTSLEKSGILASIVEAPCVPEFPHVVPHPPMARPLSRETNSARHLSAPPVAGGPLSPRS